MLRCFVILLAVMLPAYPSSAGWHFLKDGRVGQGDLAGDPVRVTFADGSTAAVPREQIDESLADVELEARVDQIIRGLSNNKPFNDAIPVLSRLSWSATPRLLHHVRTGDVITAPLAMACLQFCWTQEARQPVLEKLDSRNTTERDLAMRVLRVGESPEDLAKLLKPYTNSRYLDVAATAFGAVEAIEPDPDRLLGLIADQRRWRGLAPALTRYHDPQLIPHTQKMSLNVELMPIAYVALIHQNDDSTLTLKRMAQTVGSTVPLRRELAAEHLMWHGTTNELEALRAALAKDDDVYARASIEAAIEAIERRQRTWGDRKPAPPRRPGRGDDAPPRIDDPAEAYRQALALLEGDDAVTHYEQAMRVYRTAERFEPVLRYHKEVADRSDKADDPQAARANARLELQAKLLAIPFRSATHGQPADERQPPVAHSLIAPVRDFFEERRPNFGKLVEKTASAFFNTVHVGIDVASEREHLTVVSIGDGVVRSVGTVRSWGGIVIVEHALPDGSRFCSLYGHLSPFTCVAPGQVVKQGQKLGAIGRTGTWENGGYLAHLHFGIHLGPYAPPNTRPDWIAGYLAPDRFAADHGWIDPRNFIARHVKR